MQMNLFCLGRKEKVTELGQPTLPQSFESEEDKSENIGTINH